LAGAGWHTIDSFAVNGRKAASPSPPHQLPFNPGYIAIGAGVNPGLPIIGYYGKACLTACPFLVFKDYSL